MGRVECSIMGKSLSLINMSNVYQYIYTSHMSVIISHMYIYTSHMSVIISHMYIFTSHMSVIISHMYMYTSHMSVIKVTCTCIVFV